MKNIFKNQDLAGLIVFDGAMGTELYQKGFYINRPFEELNLSAPQEVEAVHRSYIKAGCDTITTNTFAITRPQLKNFDLESKQEEMIISALQIAERARNGSGVAIGFSIGPMGDLLEPLGSVGLEEAEGEFQAVVRSALKHPCHDHYVLETFSNLLEIQAALRAIHALDSTRPVLVSLSTKSQNSKLIEGFAKQFGDDSRVAALGLNCLEGPHDLFQSVKKLRGLTRKPIVVQPNAGIPRQVNGRYFYMTSPDYLAKYAKRFIEAGAQGVGGCCGTGPAHIEAIALTIRMMRSKGNPSGLSLQNDESANVRVEEIGTPIGRFHEELEKNYPRKPLSERTESRIGEFLKNKKQIISIELLPPKGTQLTKFLNSVRTIENAGISFVNIPDGARASTRVSSLHLAARVANEKINVSVIPHFTTRDRNLIALQADLLGAYVNGVRDVLLVTGDPPKLGTNKEATAVYDIDAIGLTYMLDCLNRGFSPTGEEIGQGTCYGIGVAANPTALNLELEHQRWNYKVESGADYAITQPIFEPDCYLKWREKLGKNDRPHIVGIWPLLSFRNAEFMANEVPGVFIPPWVLDEMQKAQGSAEEATKRGIEISQKVMERLSKECEGFCISAPLGKVAVALEVLK